MKKLILIAMALLTIGMMLYAQQGNMPMMGKDKMDKGNHQMMMKGDDDGPDMMYNRIENMKELNLTKEQKQKLADLRTDQMKFMNTKRAELKNLQIDKQNAMKDENYAKVKQLNKSITDLQLVIENTRVDHHMAIMKELTKEQQDMLKDMRPMMKGRMDDNCNQKMQKGPNKK
jgi:Spy/CpxP family protein refolding chaperone